MKTPILGAAYEAASRNAAADRCINLYYESIPHGGRDAGYLVKVPGLRKVFSVGDGPIRGMHKVGLLGFVVSGGFLYVVDSALNSRAIGGVDPGTSLVSMDNNGDQVFIACGASGYIYTISTDTFAKITDADFPGASSVIYLDGYFCFTEPLTQRFWWTEIYDGSAVDALDFTSAEGHPDNVVAMASLHREAWLFGTDTIEVFYNTGNPDLPFVRMSGAFIETGLLAPDSLARLDNSLFWVGRNQEGQNIVFRSEGYNCRRVSTHAVELAILQSSAPSRATAFTYQQSGHSFYVLNLPEQTFVYDVATGLWHERATLDNGQMGRYRADTMMQLGRRVLVGDSSSGDVYELDADCYTDNGQPMPWVRAWRALPQGSNTGALMRHNVLEVFLEYGTGNAEEPDPVVQLRWSDDGGHTWSNYHTRHTGRIGELKRRVLWRRLGSSRDRVYELSGSDPVKTIITGATLL